MRSISCLLAVAAVAGWQTLAAADFERDAMQASRKLGEVMPACSELMDAGDFQAANDKLLAIFPEAGRTAAQSFMLGNVLFESDRKLSYALHKAAAEAEPENPMVLYEWGLEQHRAGEYGAALATYDKFSRAMPKMAISYALQADCLLRLNRVDEAIDSWHRSEEAPDGDLESMESMVCAVHREPAPHKLRADLLAKATGQKDVQAAAELIALDGDFPKDWWNGGPQKDYLSHDLPAVTAALGLPDDDVRLRSLKCAAECADALDGEDGAEAKIKSILENYKLLVNDAKTLPAPDVLIPLIVGAAVSGEVLAEDDVRKDFESKLLALARKSKDAAIWNLALRFAPHDNDAAMLKLEREAWKASGDARFAAGTLLAKQTTGKLSGKDAELAAALKQFPESCLIQRIAYETAKQENKVTMKLLADAARAEFTHFSSFMSPATIITRPRSNYLRGYFGEMRKMRSAAKATASP